MKKLVLDVARLKLIMVSFLFAGLCIFSSDVTAQHATLDPLYTTPPENFVTANTAISRLDIELESMKIAISGMSHGSQQHYIAEAKYAYYDNIRTVLLDSKAGDSAAVASAIAQGLSIFASEGWEDISKNSIAEFKQGAINLLRL